ncbi:MAG: hypothetical protein BAJATHORv1_20141 [Candidatus Thorarchaeota archaeon]|nr:MAG: hypothetical protein BAJATHORv1_20141 [Candidatus Thorarchaeota archaeon]
MSIIIQLTKYVDLINMAHIVYEMVRSPGIEPGPPAWKAGILAPSPRAK